MHSSLDVPTWAMIPFLGLLAAIALLPVLAEDFWHRHHRKALVVVLFAIPVAVYLVALDRTTGRPGTTALLEGLREYASFIILLGALYVVAGGILIEGDLPGTPRNNTLVLAAGALLSNAIGTTGASMVLVRFFLRINHHRRHLGHLVVFFIIVVGNLGGLLTPLGDPPLFLGFLRGVDFFWTLRLWPAWLVANGLVLAAFYGWDTVACKTEGGLRIADCGSDIQDPQSAIRNPQSPILPSSLAPHPSPLSPRLCLRGRINILFLAGLLVAVLLRSEAVSTAATSFLRRFFPAPSLTLTFPAAEAVMIGMALLSLACSPRGIRRDNSFRWEPIVEVAILFAGIFVTMVPALDILAREGRNLRLSEPWQFFWLTGGLSAFLDNAPTYAMFATLAAGDQAVGQLMTRAPQLLQAISCGAVFLGALTYTGNGPNFMVKAIADENGYHTPSFFLYALCSAAILLPILLLITALFMVR